MATSFSFFFPADANFGTNPRYDEWPVATRRLRSFHGARTPPLWLLGHVHHPQRRPATPKGGWVETLLPLPTPPLARYWPQSCPRATRCNIREAGPWRGWHKAKLDKPLLVYVYLYAGYVRVFSEVGMVSTVGKRGGLSGIFGVFSRSFLFCRARVRDFI